MKKEKSCSFSLFPRWKDVSANLGILVAFTSAFALAGETAISMIAAGMPAECAEYAANVSSSEGNFNSVSPVVNGVRCYGAFQFCNSGTLQSYWGGSPEGFLSSPSSQVNAWLRLQKSEWSAAQRLGMSGLVGKQVCHNGTCANITQSSLLKACQFGCQGKSSKLYQLMASGLDCNAPGTKDGAGTSVCKYLVSGTGYNVSCITNTNDGIDCTWVAGTKSE
ncbi:acyltransferase [Agrobacterium tumefaciens]|uniref:acyltransferase n=1 Tax=Agrobacterium tumefaciens TaxID=358 RepID=UPI001573C451|nr:acyltransferase [Agrobacterium tumefaciens]